MKKPNVFQLNRKSSGDVQSCNGGINSFPHGSWDGGGLLLYRRFEWLEFGWMVWKVWMEVWEGGGLLMYRRFGWLEFGWMLWKVWMDGVAGNTHTS